MAQRRSPPSSPTQRRFPGSLRVPDEWFDYKPYGEVISDTRIIAVKTPLKKEFNNGHPRSEGWVADYERGVCTEDEFTPQQLVDGLGSKGLSLVAIIDLTYTNRYYNYRELEDLGVSYTKIKCPGKIVPSEDIYFRFVSALRAGLDSSDDPRSVVAVHCTHGVNRTGYLVCRFLIEKKGFTLDRALLEYQEARGHTIKKYLEHLENRPSLPVSSPPKDRSSHRYEDGQCSGYNKPSHPSNGAAQYNPHPPRERRSQEKHPHERLPRKKPPHERTYHERSYKGPPHERPSHRGPPPERPPYKGPPPEKPPYNGPPHERTHRHRERRGRADESFNWREKGSSSDKGAYEHWNYDPPQSYYYNDDCRFCAQNHPPNICCSYNTGFHSYRSPHYAAYHDRNYNPPHEMYRDRPDER